LTVRMLNINHGHNERLMEQCRVLEEYSKLVAVTRDFMRTTKDLQAALDQAIDYCIKNGILKEFLLRNRAEVLGMLLEEFDAEKYERTIRGEGLAEGEANKLREQVRKKLAKNKPISLIAEELEEEISVIEAIIGQLRH
ncbi:MAG: hypothetical protein NC302_13430, partial [Bacteroidales bacterium]|nr:hypothetical protein [Bacteroidales bacterium]MCM1417057.1 hypothetical protein [bacterium]